MRHVTSFFGQVVNKVFNGVAGGEWLAVDEDSWGGGDSLFCSPFVVTDKFIYYILGGFDGDFLLERIGEDLPEVERSERHFQFRKNDFNNWLRHNKLLRLN